MNKFIILTGLAYAGKTTLGNAIVKKFGFETVDVDVTKEQLFGEAKDEDLTHKDWVKIYKETDKQIENYLKNGKTVVDDSRNFRKFERARARKIAQKAKADFITIYVKTPAEIVKQRLKTNRENPTRHDVTDKDFEEIMNIYEPPTLDENPLVFNHGEHINDWITKYTSDLI